MRSVRWHQVVIARRCSVVDVEGAGRASDEGLPLPETRSTCLLLFDLGGREPLGRQRAVVVGAGAARQRGGIVCVTVSGACCASALPDAVPAAPGVAGKLVRRWAQAGVFAFPPPWPIRRVRHRPFLGVPVGIWAGTTDSRHKWPLRAL